MDWITVKNHAGYEIQVRAGEIKPGDKMGYRVRPCLITEESMTDNLEVTYNTLQEAIDDINDHAKE